MTLQEALDIILPLYLPSASNLREHWGARAKRAKAHRQEAFAEVRKVAPKLTPRLSAEIRLTRIARRELDAHDNLRTCFKGVIDGIADALGVDDRNPRLSFSFAQEKVSAPKALKDHQVGRVRIQITIRERAA